jgi:GNAT superfamily N-acetyltransferase
LARLLQGEEAVTWLTVATASPAAPGSDRMAAAGSGSAGTEVVANGPANSAAALEAAGLVILRRAEQLMTIDLRAHPHINAPEPYRLQTFIEPGEHGMVLSAEVWDESGERAATGTMGLSGHDAIADRILTSPAHRRHGLGGAVMSALSRAALDHGASRGILLASLDGQRLYKALGWQRVSDVLIATTPGNAYPE